MNNVRECFFKDIEGRSSKIAKSVLKSNNGKTVFDRSLSRADCYLVA